MNDHQLTPVGGGSALLTFWPMTRLSHASSTSSFSWTNSETLSWNCAIRLPQVVSVAGFQAKHVGVYAEQDNSCKIERSVRAVQAVDSGPGAQCRITFS